MKIGVVCTHKNILSGMVCQGEGHYNMVLPSYLVSFSVRVWASCDSFIHVDKTYHPTNLPQLTLFFFFTLLGIVWCFYM
jgi:hypothetical protein